MSIPRFDVNLPLQITRRVVVDEERAVAVNAVLEDFRGRIYPPHGGEETPADDASPRSYVPRHVLWYKPVALANDVRPGDRVTDGLETFEVVRAAHGKRAGVEVLVVEAQLIKVSSLYPVLADLTDKGDPAVIGEVIMSIWETGENDTDRGQYKALAAEAPVEFFNSLSVTNREARFGGKVHRIDDVTLHLGQPHVSMTLRAKA